MEEALERILYNAVHPYDCEWTGRALDSVLVELATLCKEALAE